MADESRILTNKAQCGDCGMVIESKHRHDFVECGCGHLHVDGGREYLKRGFKEGNQWIELSITEEKV